MSSDGLTASKPRHGVSHHLLTQPGPPVFAKHCCLNPEKLATTMAEFAIGIVQSSNTSWYSSLHMVKKKDGAETIGG